MRYISRKANLHPIYSPIVPEIYYFLIIMNISWDKDIDSIAFTSYSAQTGSQNEKKKYNSCANMKLKQHYQYPYQFLEP